MKKYSKILIWIGAFILLVGGSSIGYQVLKERYGNQERLQVVEDEGTAATEGTEEETDEFAAPDFKVYDKDGQEVTLKSKVGKPIVLNFWASWCGPCKSEMPDFQKVYEELDVDVEFMMVNLTDGSRETKESALQHIEDNEYTFPVYFDIDQNAAYMYNVSSIPTTYFIDASGNLITYAQGMIEEEDLLKGIDLITEKSEIN
ncbi:TlpA family protein disulfide reductase [Anaeromicropila populeti]|uniref:Thiol-disulfide isomerase or thioredoxin n=1 Tax=Anaeromicropila populeti TaxID=37658 RepID=A0A1I6HII8_9FIRM|nr:TlpA disulfide reductase family protein [Anaeromicropila populeti]SFR54097.1 Thiol-disulfide isomerase or thioredoxin [Anaeromicropila populeti]